VPRIAGVDIPKAKPMSIALTYIFGIGKHTAEKILVEAEIDFTVRAGSISDQEAAKIQKHYLLKSTK